MENVLADHWVRTGNIGRHLPAGSPSPSCASARRAQTGGRTRPVAPANQSGPGAAERQIALHTLLVRDLIASDPATFLPGCGLIPADYKEATLPPTRPGEPVAQRDVRLSAFQWRGEGTPQGLPLPGSGPDPRHPGAAPDDGHALNCFRGAPAQPGSPYRPVAGSRDDLGAGARRAPHVPESPRPLSEP